MTYRMVLTFFGLVFSCFAQNLCAEVAVITPPLANTERNYPASTMSGAIAIQNIVFENGAVKVITNGKLNSFSSFRLGKPARLVVDLSGVTNQLRNSVYPTEMPPVSSVRVVPYNDKLRLIIEAVPNQEFPDARIDSTNTGLVVNLQEKNNRSNTPLATSYVPYDAPLKDEVIPAKSKSGTVVSSLGHSAAVEMIDFQVIDGISRLSIKVKGDIDADPPEKTPGFVTLTIKNAHLPRHLQRSLETGSFISPVLRVTPFMVLNHSRTDARIRVTMRSEAAFVFRQEGDLLYVEFNNPEGLTSSSIGIDSADTRQKDVKEKFTPQKSKAAEVSPPNPVPLPLKISSAFSRDSKTDARKFSGKKISMEFDNAELRQIFRLLGDVSGDNIIIGDDVKGNYTIKFVEVPWDQAIEMILLNNNLVMEHNGNVIEILTHDKIKKRRDQMLERQKQLFEQKLAEERMKTIGESVDNKSEEIVTARCQVKNTTAADILPVLNILLSKYRAVLGSSSTINTTKTNANVTPQTGGVMGGGGFSGEATFDKSTTIQSQSSYKAEYGEMYPEANTNTIIINDRKDVIKKAESIISILDVPKKQVLIEARMVEASVSFTREIGVQWGVHYRDGTASLLGINALDSGFGGIASQPPSSGTSGPGISTGISFGTLASNIQLDARLSAAASLGSIKIISNPKVVTTYGFPAKITQGQQIPYTSSTADKIETKFITAALVLDVTPRITPSGGVLMDLKVSNDSAGTGNPPSINKKETTTQMTIQDNETAVIGGIYTNSDTDFDQGVPYFMDIPVLGNLFKSRTKTKVQTEMLIFLTPRLLDKDKQIPKERTQCLIVE